jgi:O-antigen/teichoic acid export membrane protein
LGFIRIIVIARLISPDEFGIFGIVSLTMSALNTISRVGMDQALIQKDGDIRPFLNTAWTVRVLRGLVLFGLVVLLSPVIATFFSESEVVGLLKLFGLSLVFKGFTNIGVVSFRKELHFRKEFLLQFTSVLFGVLVSLILAFMLENALALVGGVVGEALALMMVSYIVHPYRPGFRWHKESFQELFQFGKWITGSSVLVFALTEGDDLVAGKLVGTAALGYYQMAYRVSNLPATELMRVVNQVMFPALSKVKDSVDQLQNTFLRSFQLTAALTMLMSGLIIALAKEFTLVILGSKWLNIVLPMQILAVWGAVRALGGSTSPVFLAIGKPKLITYFQALMLAVMAVVIIPLTNQFGIIGTSWAVVLSNLLVHWLRYPLIARYTEVSIWKILRLILLPFISTVLMILLLSVLKRNSGVLSGPTLWSLLALGLIGSLVYFTTLVLYQRLTDYDVLDLIRRVILAFADKQNLKGLLTGD